MPNVDVLRLSPEVWVNDSIIDAGNVFVEQRTSLGQIVLFAGTFSLSHFLPPKPGTPARYTSKELRRSAADNSPFERSVSFYPFNEGECHWTLYVVFTFHDLQSTVVIYILRKKLMPHHIFL